MFKRLIWWAAGAAMGSAGSLWAQRKLKRAVKGKVPRVAVPRAMGNASGAARELAKDLRSVVSEGRHAMRAKEVELRRRHR